MVLANHSGCIFACSQCVVWSCTATYGPNFQGILGSYDLTGCTALVPPCKGPAGSIMKSCVVTGEFSSSCLLVSRTIQLLDGTTIITSASIPNGKFGITINFPPNSLCDKQYYIRICAERVNVSSNLGNPCGITVKSGSGNIICTCE
jgi:hypothetical protein